MKNIKKILIIIFLLILIINTKEISLAYTNDSIIYYDGKSKEFTYFNTNKEDLFKSFKNLMPGDIKEETIYIKTNNLTNITNMYLKIDSNNNEDTLKKIKFKIETKDNIIYDNTNIDTTSILHKFEKEEDIPITFKIEIPKEIGNELQDLTMNFKWNFLIEENDKIVEVPFTYDNSNIIINITLAITSLLSIIILLFIKNKKDKATN